MKRCPECRRDYFDDTLSFCLADGAELVYGETGEEHSTAILSQPLASSEAPTRRREEPEPAEMMFAMKYPHHRDAAINREMKLRDKSRTLNV